ncbi:MAG TPA: lipopolysaccharide assembly protein LapA domain-containing protein [Stellaceae bacterium]|nr:lipopolysaccharide assembly protein LapA domain-containing protein [Stellaceae bacterium]
MKFFGWLVLALAALAVTLFAVSNRESVSLGLWPLPSVIDLPLYLVVLGGLVLGFVVGELAGWLGARRWRREARRARARIAALEGDLAAARARVGAPALPAETVPR